ncbi:PilC/PilY family type IV pilus protein [uncultured Cocleimonas sp.]|uniref:PilC/PilY family type IV pilus protein n=1 Tax=uncultured Cocleimonas sp. TaxID=1051587 RepID=UPI00261A46B7|nr:PilC/PilY family type IV pilus protein [uncultured Cocleimonas sp.]
MKNLTNNLKTTLKTFLALSIVASGVGVYADDTEVFYSVNVSKPNLLFVLDNSGSMNSNLPGGTQSKLSILQQAVQQVLLDAPDNVNIGLMRFGPGMNGSEWTTSNEGNRTHGVSGVSFPLRDINSKARDVIPTTGDVYGLGVYPTADEQVRNYASRVVNNWTASGGTPLVGALYEAALYFRGEEMRYGYDSPTGATGVGAHPTTYSGSIITNNVSTSTRDYSQAPKYTSPINSSCQANYIVMMSDGQPTYYYDGSANTQGAAWSESRGPFAQIMQGNSGFGNLALNISDCTDTPSTFAAGKCGPELTQYIATNDNVPDPTGSFPEGKYGNQIIETFTIGFGTGAGTNTESYLKSLATYDDENSGTNDDGYFLASSPTELAAAFKKILEEVVEPKGTLASPGYSVNVKNGLEHEKDIYIPVFDRKNTSRWSGNLKKFKIVDVDGRRLIRGKNNQNATDELGGFTASALDYWSDSPNSDPDGKAVEKGGLANKLTDPAARKIYSNLTGDTNIALSVGNDNKLDMSVNPNISNADLGLSSSSNLAYRTQIVNFMRGWDQGLYNASSSSPGTPRLHMGDMLHSEPLVVTYEKGSSSGSGKQQYIFAGTNEGYLHAFDTETGEEKFAFIPAELLKTLSEPQFLNTGNQDDHKYGVDGSLTYWFKGGDDGSVNSGDQIIVYFGLRRGGSSYYALDVTDIDNPVLLWKRSYDSSIVGNKSMGQSWSVPYLDKVGVTGSTCIDGSLNCQEVVIVSGGYDEDEDRDSGERTFCANENSICNIPTGKSVTVWYGANDTWVSRENVTGDIACRNSVFGDPLVGVFKTCEIEEDDGGYNSTMEVTADVGNDIQIYNADNGDLIWSMPDSMRSQIQSSIPGGVRVLDTNYNGLIDRMYFADTGGNVWRLDLSETLSSSDNSSVLTKLASLGGSGSNSRKFYNEPDAAKMILNGKTVFAISIGSGFRAGPLDKAISDNFFVLIDESPYTAYTDVNPKATSAIVTSDLATLNVSLTGSSQVDSIKDANKRGWVVNFADAGEKVLGGALTVDGGVIFTTLVPEVITNNSLIDQCAAPATQSRLYAIDLLTGGAILDLNGDGVVTADDIGELQGTEILNKVQIVYNPPVITEETSDDGEPTGDKSCTHPVDIRAGKKLSQSSGYDACRLESVYWSDPQAE